MTPNRTKKPIARTKKHTIRAGLNGETKEVQLTPASAIQAFCYECMGFEQTVHACTSTLCPLYPFRTTAVRRGKKA